MTTTPVDHRYVLFHADTADRRKFRLHEHLPEAVEDYPRRWPAHWWIDCFRRRRLVVFRPVSSSIPSFLLRLSHDGVMCCLHLCTTLVVFLGSTPRLSQNHRGHDPLFSMNCQPASF